MTAKNMSYAASVIINPHSAEGNLSEPISKIVMIVNFREFLV